MKIFRVKKLGSIYSTQMKFLFWWIEIASTPYEIETRAILNIINRAEEIEIREAC